MLNLISLLVMPVLALATDAMTQEELNRRLSETIATTIDRRVVLEDVTGEGPGAWDADPRYPTDTVNCMIWLQLLMAEVYGKGLPDKTPVLDRIRYFGGQVGFGTRKHYTDHWLAVDPGPLKKVDFTACAKPAVHHVKLNFKPFTDSRKYSCGLYEMNRSELQFDYAPRDKIADCARSLKSGYYILFAVPTQKFLKRSLKQTGPMGLVHAMVLKLRDYDAAKGPRALSSTLVYHASTAAAQVQVEPFEKFLAKSKNIHRGYVVYELDPSWNYRLASQLNQNELQALTACEKKLPANSSH